MRAPYDRNIKIINVRMKVFCSVIVIFFSLLSEKSLSQPALERLLKANYMKGVSVSMMIKDMTTGEVVHSFDADREVMPASVMKIVTTASALELLGPHFSYKTQIMYDGRVGDNTLYGNLYIYGSGDPSLGSAEVGKDRDKILIEWVEAIKKAGITSIIGSVIADESIFDSEGVSMKWMLEDLGNYYGSGSYGLNIFDNIYTLYLKTDSAKPDIIRSIPDMSFITFYNNLTTNQANRDSAYIIGLPLTNERFLHGVIPSNPREYSLKGDIPDPSLFLAQYFTQLLVKNSVKVSGAPACYRILEQNNVWLSSERTLLTSTSSPPLHELIRITNFVSHNLYADALLKTIGLHNNDNDSSFGKGIQLLKKYWEDKGINTSSLWMYDGSGLAATNKLTASFLCDLLTYMFTQSSFSTQFIESLPRAGMDGTVANILRNSVLQGVTRLKSGSMSRVRSYAGYVTKGQTSYALAIIFNNFSCSQAQMKSDIEHLLISLLP